MIRLVSIGLAAIALSGCISILPDAKDLAPRLALDPGLPAAVQGPALPVSLVIADPAAEAVYNTFAVAVATGPFQYEYVPDAEWTDRAPVMLRKFMRRKFENTGQFTAVGDMTSLPMGDYTLQTDVRAFHIAPGDRGQQAVITLGVRLANPQGTTIGTRVVSTEAQVLGDTQSDIAEAMNAAAEAMAAELIPWVAGSIRAAQR